MVLLTTRVSVLEVGIEAFVHELDHLVHSIGLDVVHEFLQAGLQAEKQDTTPSASESLHAFPEAHTLQR